MILFVTTADTEILAAERAGMALPEGFPSVESVNPASIGDAASFVDGTLGRARVVIVRLLGGRSAWPGFDLLRAGCLRASIPLLAFGGEAAPDAEMAAASTVAPGVAADAFEYLRHGGVANMANLFAFVGDTVLNEGNGFEPAAALPEAGLYRPELIGAHQPGRPKVGIIFYRTHWMSGNTGFIDTLVEAVIDAGGDPLPVFCYSLRPDPAGRVLALDLLDDRGHHVDALIVTVLASGGSNAADALAGAGDDRPDGWLEWNVPALERLGVPVVQGICATVSRRSWEASASGLSPLDAAMQVAIPEFDGRIVGVAFSFKEPLEANSPVKIYRADPERARRLAGLAVRHGRLRQIPNAQKKIAVVLSNYPTKHSRVGNAVGLDTPASLVRLLAAMALDGYTVEGVPRDGDALIHALIASGGHDVEFLTEDQLRGATGRLEVSRYAEWFEALPEGLREAMRSAWGEPPGSLYVDGDAIVVAGMAFGNVFVCIQPPRGFGENPIAIYHDPDLPPTHHYLAAYCWLDRVFGADGVIHLGKHGTLEWLPGKSLALSAGCAPDAVLGDLPLFYPFVVNDPGEGTQAKRRAHAVIIDHLVPPMMRAETYDDLARLEQLLDEHAQVQALDPSKLPAIRARIWELVRQAELHRDLGLEAQPGDFDEFVLHLDGYLCEIKDLRIRDGLHILGAAPAGEQRLGLLAAILRLGSGEVRGLRRAVTAAFGLDEAVLLAEPGARAGDSPELRRWMQAALGAKAPASTGSDLIDALEEASHRLLAGMDARGWDASAAPAVCEGVLGLADAGVVQTLAFAATDVVPRLDRTGDEIGNLLRGLGGRFVASGPSGSPTRGLVNVLPTGRNFYSVDPKALPSNLAWETGKRLADDLVRRYLDEEAAFPESVGIVVWGTSAMRTQGDDIAEILALLGVRPVWDASSRRVTGIEVLPLETLGRPRIDVTVRISGFFRDAFPNLIALIDEAVRAVAGLDEPDDANYVAKHARADLARGIDARRCTTRIFGSKPGAYGAGLLPLIDARNWRTDADLAQVYEVWGGYAYGQGIDGTLAVEAMRDNFTRIRVAVKNVDNREHDLLDSDDYFQYHGGMVAAVRALTGVNPRAYIGDSSDPAAPKTRALAEETRRVFRARVANPRWITSMMRHGYKGAFELSATVDYLFGYDATAGVVDDWMYRTIAEKYVFDAETAAFMRRSNPWALRAVAERLLEAAERKLWADPEAEVLEHLRRTYLDLEGDLEDAAP